MILANESSFGRPRDNLEATPIRCRGEPCPKFTAEHSGTVDVGSDFCCGILRVLDLKADDRRASDQRRATSPLKTIEIREPLSIIITEGQRRSSWDFELEPKRGRAIGFIY
jgi:hypothetical protein